MARNGYKLAMKCCLFLFIRQKVGYELLRSLNVQPRELPQLDGYYYPPVTGIEGGRVMVATHVSTQLTYSPLVSPASSVGCRLTTCAVSIRTKRSDRQTSRRLMLPSPRGLLELEECSSTPLNGGTKSVPRPPRPKGVLFRHSRQTCQRRTKRLCAKPRTHTSLS